MWLKRMFLTVVVSAVLLATLTLFSGVVVSDSSKAIPLESPLADLPMPSQLAAKPLPRHVDVEEAVADKVDIDMTEDEIIRALGVPPGDYAARPTFYIESLAGPSLWREKGCVTRQWFFDTISIAVTFRDGRAVGIWEGIGFPEGM